MHASPTTDPSAECFFVLSRQARVLVPTVNFNLESSMPLPLVHIPQVRAVFSLPTLHAPSSLYCWRAHSTTCIPNGKTRQLTQPSLPLLTLWACRQAYCCNHSITHFAPISTQRGDAQMSRVFRNRSGPERRRVCHPAHVSSRRVLCASVARSLSLDVCVSLSPSNSTFPLPRH